MKYISLCILVLILSACATSNEIYTADGERAHTIDCSGILTWGDCYEKAGEI
jgi:hypothetical protein